MNYCTANFALLNTAHVAAVVVVRVVVVGSAP
ncbi:ilvB operon leader peptide IvbL [Yersinia pseudotuberculosis]|nr:ilvB operon leader peptide IvbL [Yersinia pseudotuberculosis]